MDLRRKRALSGYRWTRPLTGESASSWRESSVSLGWSGIMRDLSGMNCRAMGSCRGSFQLIRLRMYGLSRSVSGVFLSLALRGWWAGHSRHPDSHGGGRDALEDILNKLFASLCPRVVVWHLLWESGL